MRAEAPEPGRGPLGAIGQPWAAGGGPGVTLNPGAHLRVRIRARQSARSSSSAAVHSGIFLSVQRFFGTAFK